MCVTFTGCELLCGEIVNRQQSSHATLKPKLQVQIMMMVIKGNKRKGLWELRLNQANERQGWAWGCLVFPMGVRKATNHMCRGSWGRDQGLAVSTSPTSRPKQEWDQELLPLLLPSWEGRSSGVSGKWIWKPESAQWLFDNPGKSISQECLFPGEGERWFPCSPLSLTETKMRMDINVKRIDKNPSKWTSRWGGGTNVNHNLGSHLKTYQMSTRFVLWATGSL